MRIPLVALLLMLLSACGSGPPPQGETTKYVVPDGTTQAVCADGMPPPCTR
jgi:hypothetical protein